MSKKHFIELADCLKKQGHMPQAVNTAINAVAGHLSLEDKHGLQEFIMGAVASELADFCKSQNGNFNRERWLSYIAGTCGPNGGKVAA